MEILMYSYIAIILLFLNYRLERMLNKNYSKSMKFDCYFFIVIRCIRENGELVLNYQ